jgi:hypothetical protein
LLQSTASRLPASFIFILPDRSNLRCCNKQTKKQTLLTPESLEQQILPQKFVRNFAAAAAPPTRASPENQNLQGERVTATTTPLVEDVDCIFLLFLSHFFGGSGKEEEGRQSTSIRRLSGMGEPGNWRFSKQ